MILRTLLTAALLATAAHAADFDRTLTVTAQPDLYVSTGAGRIHIFPGSDNQIHIRAHLYANWNANGDLDGRMTRIAQNPPIQQSGNAIHVGDVAPSDRKLFNNITIDYEITVPTSVALNLHTGSGDVEVDNAGRFLTAYTGSGSIRANGLAGTADLQTGSGDIELHENAPAEVRTRTGSGSIRVYGLGGSLTAHTGSGDIEAHGTVTALTHLETGSGSIRLHLGHDARYNLDATTGSGSIRYPGSYTSDAHHLSAPINGGGPTIEAHTGSGDIQFD